VFKPCCPILQQVVLTTGHKELLNEINKDIRGPVYNKVMTRIGYNEIMSSVTEYTSNLGLGKSSKLVYYISPDLWIGDPVSMGPPLQIKNIEPSGSVGRLS